MKIRLLAAEMVPGQGITLDEFQSHLEKLSTTQVTFGGFDRLYLTKTIDKDRVSYNVGLLVSIKDQKRFLELRQKQQGKFTVEVRELERGSKLMDFNYFVQNRDTGRGLYQYYHHSCALQRFGGFLSERYRDHRKAIIDKEIEEAGGDSISESKKKKIRAKYKGHLALSQMVSPNKLDDLMKEMDRFKRFEFTVGTVSAPDFDFAPLSKYVKRRSVTLAFDKAKGGSSAIRTGIHKLINKVNPMKGRVVGVDADGIERFASILENYDTYGEYEFDEAAKDMKFDLEEFEKSEMIKKMIAVVEEHGAFFSAPVED